MKACGNCGYECQDNATHCEQCGWSVPQLDTATKTGRWLQRIAVVAVIVLMLRQCAFVPSRNGGFDDDLPTWISLLWLVIGSGVAAVLYWIGGYLKRGR